MLLLGIILIFYNTISFSFSMNDESEKNSRHLKFITNHYKSDTEIDYNNTSIDDNNTSIDDNNTSIDDNNTSIDDNNTEMRLNREYIENNTNTHPTEKTTLRGYLYSFFQGLGALNRLNVFHPTPFFPYDHNNNPTKKRIK